jgi:membrane-associated phospholipid phosphatase
VVVLVAAAILIAVSADVRWHGLFTQLDHRVGMRMLQWDLRDRPWPRRGLTVGLYFGQRGVALTAAVLFLGWLSWHYRTIEPMVRLFVGVAALVLVVYGFKWGLARAAPVQYFHGHRGAVGASYPSGHVANAVLLWGLADVCAARWPVPVPLARLIRIGRWIGPFVIVVCMTLLNYHWLSDFAGGACVGVLLLALSVRPVWSTLTRRLAPRGWAG